MPSEDFALYTLFDLSRTAAVALIVEREERSLESPEMGTIAVDSEAI